MRIICKVTSLDSFSQDFKSHKNIWKCLGRAYTSLMVPTRAYRKDGEDGLGQCSDRRRGNGSKLKERGYRLDIMKKYFTVRVLKHWDRLPTLTMGVSSMEVFKIRLDGALSSERRSCPWQGSWKQMVFKVHSDPNHSVILWSLLSESFQAWDLYLESLRSYC